MVENCNYNPEWKFSEQNIPYEKALNFMEDRVAQIIMGKAQEMIWVLEHDPVYTAGISAKDLDLLDAQGVTVFKTNRGGKYTYHCPGMKIIYVMLDLKKLFAPNKPDIAKFVEFLENWIIAILAEYGIKGEIRKNRVGIWVETIDEKNRKSEKKIAAIGIKIKKWVSFHGIAVNISCDLEGFKNIVPCGISEFGITSAKDLGFDIKKDFNKIVKEKFFQQLGKL